MDFKILLTVLNITDWVFSIAPTKLRDNPASLVLWWHEEECSYSGKEKGTPVVLPERDYRLYRAMYSIKSLVICFIIWFACLAQFTYLLFQFIWTSAEVFIQQGSFKVPEASGEHHRDEALLVFLWWWLWRPWFLICVGSRPICPIVFQLSLIITRLLFCVGAEVENAYGVDEVLEWFVPCQTHCEVVVIMCWHVLIY